MILGVCVSLAMLWFSFIHVHRHEHTVGMASVEPALSSVGSEVDLVNAAENMIKNDFHADDETANLLNLKFDAKVH